MDGELEEALKAVASDQSNDTEEVTLRNELRELLRQEEDLRGQVERKEAAIVAAQGDLKATQDMVREIMSLPAIKIKPPNLGTNGGNKAAQTRRKPPPHLGP